MRLYQHKSRWPRTLIVSSLGLLLSVFLAVTLLNQTSERVQGEQQATLENALRRASVTCYALEGRYPATLDYLTEYYGVVIDEGRFVVSYNVFARNVMPDIQVNPIGDDRGVPMTDLQIDLFEVIELEAIEFEVIEAED